MTLRHWMVGCVPLPALAADHVLGTSSLLVNLMQVVLGLAVVLVAIFGAAALFRRFSSSVVGMQSCMKIVSALMVGQRERVVIIALGDEWLVLGVTSHSVNLLARMPCIDTPPTVVSAEPFARWLKSAVSKKPQPSDSTNR